jgi:monothiol glutaredoxin
MTDTALRDKVEELIRDHPVLLFMKGTPEAPRCGFSMRVVGVLDTLGVEYGAIDVLPALEPLREATGEISDWRTFPQLYVNGDLVGGADIVEEMFESGELAELLDVEQPPEASSAAAASDRVGLDAGRLLGGVLANLERGAAAAGRDDVRVVDREPGALEAVDVVDLGAEHELHADLVDDDRNAVVLEDVIVVARLVESERVLEARAPAAADSDPKRLLGRIRLGRQQLVDLLGRLVGQDDCFLGRLHCRQL